MSSKTLCASVRFAAIVVAVCGVFLLWVFHKLISDYTQVFLDFCIYNDVFPTVIPWRMIVSLASLPCLGVLICMWAVSNTIARDTVFTNKTAKWISRSAFLLFADAGFVFAANIVMFLLSYSHPGVLFVCIIVTLAFVALGLLAAVLSRYIAKAADLQEISEGTI